MPTPQPGTLQKIPRAPASNGRGLHKRRNKIAAIAQNVETANSDSQGLLLLDRFLKPIYVSEKAVSILCYPEGPHKNAHLRAFLLRKIASLIPGQDGSLCPKIPDEFASGKRLYQVRVFTLQSHLGNGPRPTLAVILERERRASVEVTQAAAKKFRLTQRETEALELLTLGYKTREIAGQMAISPNTAKTFLRSVMFKIGARERSGILVKILQFAKGLEPFKFDIRSDTYWSVQI